VIEMREDCQDTLVCVYEYGVDIASTGTWVGSHNSDFADRDKLIQLLKEKLGELNVLPISNYNGFQLKSLVKDVSRFFHRDENDGLSFQDVNKVLTSLDEEVRRKVLKQGDDKNLFELKLDDCLQHSPAFKQFMDEHPEVLAPLKTLLHENKALGKHAAGVIISERIPERMPVIKSRGNPQTPWVEGMHYKHLNELGFIKYDLLGLETLRIIERCVNLILKHFAGKKLTLTLEDGSSIECFENDKILLSDGTLKRASDLTDEDDITEPVKITAGYALHKM
jgi:DNA polymerase III alpha subunit